MFPSGGTNHVSVGLGLSYTHVLNAPSRRLWLMSLAMREDPPSHGYPEQDALASPKVTGQTESIHSNLVAPTLRHR